MPYLNLLQSQANLNAVSGGAQVGAAGAQTAKLPKIDTNGLNAAQKQGLQLALTALSQNPFTSRQFSAAAELNIPIKFGNDGLEQGAAANTRFTNNGRGATIQIGTSFISRLTDPKEIAVQLAGALGNEVWSGIGVTTALKRGGSLQTMLTKQQEAGSFVGDNYFKAVVSNAINGGNPAAPVNINQIQGLFRREYGKDLSTVMKTASVYKDLSPGAVTSSSIADMTQAGMFPPDLAVAAQQWVTDAVGSSAGNNNNQRNAAKTVGANPSSSAKPSKENLSAASTNTTTQSITKTPSPQSETTLGG